MHPAFLFSLSMISSPRPAAAPARRRAPWAAGLAVLLALSGASLAQEDPDPDRIRTAYVHVLRHVDWPGVPGDTLRVCVHGTDEIATVIGGLGGRTIGQRTLVIERDAPFDPARCQALFLGRSEKRWPQLLERLRGLNVLTTSDVDGFARRGGIVGFYPSEGRIRLEINVEAAHAAGLRVGANLLELSAAARGPAP